MKSQKKFILLVVLVAVLSCFTFSAFADDPNPPAVPGEHGQGGDVPMGAPIDSGLTVLLMLGAGYAIVKLYQISKKKPETAD